MKNQCVSGSSFYKKKKKKKGKCFKIVCFLVGVKGQASTSMSCCIRSVTALLRSTTTSRISVKIYHVPLTEAKVITGKKRMYCWKKIQVECSSSFIRYIFKMHVCQTATYGKFISWQQVYTCQYLIILWHLLLSQSAKFTNLQFLIW